MFNAKKVKEDIVIWIREQFKINGGKTAVIGISGGKDSSVVAALCVEALGKENVLGVMMPQGRQKDIDYSYDLVKHLGIKYCVVNIGESVEAEIRSVEDGMGCKLSEQAMINIPARIRMVTLYGVAQTVGHGRVTCNTNLSESYVGYGTKFADTVGDIAPIKDLTVTEVKALGKELGLPEHLIEKKPADGLSGLTDEDNFGFTYEVLDRYIREGICEDEEIRNKINRLHNYNLHKLQLIPKFESK